MAFEDLGHLRQNILLFKDLLILAPNPLQENRVDFLISVRLRLVAVLRTALLQERFDFLPDHHGGGGGADFIEPVVERHLVYFEGGGLLGLLRLRGLVDVDDLITICADISAALVTHFFLYSLYK